MCIIFLKPEGVKIPHDILESGWDRNPHGWGIMRPGRKEPFIRKGAKNFGQFMNNYVNMFEDYACAIHFRQATGGNINDANAHPFHVKNDIWMMHNGMFPEIPIIEKGMSDTYHFAKILSKISLDIRDPEIEYLLDNQEGQQRLLFMDQKGFVIVGESGWFRDDKGVYYSNSYAWKVPANKQLYIGGYEVLSGTGKLRAKPTSKNHEKKANEYRNWWMKQILKYDSEKDMSTRDQYVPTSIDKTRQNIIDNITTFDKEDLVNFCKTDPTLMVEVIKSTLPKVSK